MKLSELRAGDLVLTDDAFTCFKPGAYTIQADAKGRLFIPCDKGRHYLDGQVSFTDPDKLIGITKAAPVPHRGGELQQEGSMTTPALPRGAYKKDGRAYNMSGDLIEVFEGRWRIVKDGRRLGWWRFNEHYDRQGYCDNPARGY